MKISPIRNILTRSFSSSYIVFFIAFFIIATIEPITILGTAETSSMTIPLARYLLFVLSISVLGLLIIATLLPRLFNFFLAIAVAGSFVSLRISYHPGVSGMPIIVFCALFVFLVLLVFSVMHFLKKSDKKPTLVAYTCLLFIGLSSPIFYWINDYGKLEGAAESSLSSVTLKDKPNIYVFSYDSLIPEDVAKENFAIDSVAYQQVVSEEFLELENGLSFHIPSRPSVNDIMRLGQKDQPLSYLAFSGNVSSLLPKFLQSNGYKIVTGYRSFYFGSTGPYIDEGLFPESPQIEASVLCVAQERLERVQSFLICDVARFLKAHGYSQVSALVFGMGFASSINDWHLVLRGSFERNSKSSKPTFTYLHTYHPIGHTSLIYDHSDKVQREEYKEQFLSFSEILADQLDEIADQLSRYDPNAIVVITGDHGVYLSRSSEIMDDPVFYYRDRHRILIAIAKSEHRCSDPDNLMIEVGYNTPARVLSGLLTCLASADQPVLENDSFDEQTDILRFILSSS